MYYLPTIENSDTLLTERAQAALYKRYGDTPHEKITKRLKYELDMIARHGYEAPYLIAWYIAKEAAKHEMNVMARLAAGDSFTAFLLGITGVNPLKPHYYCPGCKKVFFEDENCVDGYDLPGKNCPLCGSVMRGDGHDMPFESFTGANGEELPMFSLVTSPELFYRATGVLQSLVSDCEIVRVIGYYRSKFGMKSHLKVGRLCFIPKDRMGIVPICEYKSRNRTVLAIEEKDAGEYLQMDIAAAEELCRGTINDEFDPCKMSYATVTDEFQQKLEMSLPFFDIDSFKKTLIKYSPTCFSEFVKLLGLFYNCELFKGAEELMDSQTVSLAQLPVCREDIYNDFIKNGADKKEAYRIMKVVTQAKTGRELPADDFKRYGFPEWYYCFLNKAIEVCPKASIFSVPKAHLIANAKLEIMLKNSTQEVNY